VSPQSEYIDGNGFIAEVIRTRRVKSADIRVEDGAVSVVVPRELSIERVEALLNDKRQWIRQKVLLHQEALPVSIKEYVSGESFSYLGRNYRLRLEKGSYAPVKLYQGRLVVTLPDGNTEPHMVRNALVSWYKKQARKRFKDKVKRFAPIIGVEPAEVDVKTFKARWGSCSAKGKLDFNWKVLLAPNRIVDYVVVHELCHIKQHDHSPKFWKEVERVMPDYKDCKRWLKENSATLEV